MLNTPFVSQDTLGGGFDATQAFVGELANLNIWNRKLSITEIYNLATCNSKASTGDVFSWTESNIEVFGGATKWTFEPCRSANWTASHRWRKAYLYFWAFVVLVFIWRLLETIWVIGKLKSGISTILRYPCCKTTRFILREKKRIYFILETSVRKYCCYPFSFLDIQLKAHLSFSFGLFRLGLAAGNLRLMFGQFTIQVRNYITTLAPPSFRRVGDYAVRPILVSVWRCKVMSDAVQLPVTPPFLPCLPAALPPPPLCPAPPELALWLMKRNARRGGYVEGHCKVKLWYKSICNHRSLQVFL